MAPKGDRLGPLGGGASKVHLLTASHRVNGGRWLHRQAHASKWSANVSQSRHLSVLAAHSATRRSVSEDPASWQVISMLSEPCYGRF